MCKIFGYGEDAFTLWALKHRTSIILKSFQDETSPSDCLVFYRPSFGRSGGEKSAQFGEFDAIVVSLENVYLIESKWDNLAGFRSVEISIRQEQELRHHIFSWYVTHWDERYDNWASFVKENSDDFQRNFRKKIARSGTTLAKNIQFILTMLKRHCVRFSSEQNIKNVLLFFYNKNKYLTPTKISREFKLIKIEYSKEITGNFINLDCPPMRTAIKQTGDGNG